MKPVLLNIDSCRISIRVDASISDLSVTEDNQLFITRILPSGLQRTEYAGFGAEGDPERPTAEEVRQRILEIIHAEIMDEHAPQIVEF